jgi:hypothetical protein
VSRQYSAESVNRIRVLAREGMTRREMATASGFAQSTVDHLLAIARHQPTPDQPATGRTVVYPGPPVFVGAACTGEGDVMHPDRRDRAGIIRAQAICARCPVGIVTRCRDYALAWPGPLIGVWGGMSPGEIDARKRAANKEAAGG